MHPSLSQSEDGWPPPDTRNDSLREGRQRFVAAFPDVCDSIEVLLKTISARGPKGSSERLHETAEALAGAALPAGFPKVSEHAAELAMLAGQADRGFNLDAARGLLEAVRATYARETASPPAWAAEAAPWPPVAGSIRVLVVDECEEERQALADYLQLGGYEPVVVSSRSTVIDAARQYLPGSIVLEADLPGPDGFALCREMKADPELAGIPVIVLTARASLDETLNGLTLGVYDCLPKPVDPREVLLRVDEALRPGAGK